MRRLLAMAVTIVVPAMAPVASEAKCMVPGAFVSPDSGATLPPDPVLHIFVPWSMAEDANGEAAAFDVDLSADGAAVASQVELVSRAPAFWTYRVRIARATPARLMMSVRFGEAPQDRIEASYVIGPTGQMVTVPTHATGRPVREIRFWMCSHQLTWNVPLRVEAPAYRVEWAYSLVGYEAGARTSVVFPRRMDSFFNWRHEPSPSPPRVELGHVNCMGTTASWRSQKRLYVGIWALQPDGTEIALNDEPIVLLKP